MNRHIATRIALGAAFSAILAFCTPAGAALDVAFGADVQLDDDTSLYVSIASRYYDQDRRDVNRWQHQCEDPDDLAVVLFLAERARTRPDYVFSLRTTGLSWWQIGLRIGVPADAWFPAVRRDPGPPFGKAYGHWKKHGRTSPTEMRLSDADARNLVAVRLLHEYYGISVEAAMDRRASERPLGEIAAAEYRARHDDRSHGMRGVAYGSMVGGAGAPGKSAHADKSGPKAKGKKGR